MVYVPLVWGTFPLPMSPPYFDPDSSYGKPRQRIKEQRHHFADKGPYGKAMIFPVVMYGCESWTIKKAEHQRTDAFEL